MTNEQKNINIAAATGQYVYKKRLGDTCVWLFHKDEQPHLGKDSIGGPLWTLGCVVGEFEIVENPDRCNGFGTRNVDYFNDLSACRDARLSLTPDQQTECARELLRLHFGNKSADKLQPEISFAVLSLLINSSAEQQAEALGKALNLW